MSWPRRPPSEADLVEGPAGTGKTQLAKSVSEVTGARLIRLQCYEGLDEAKALVEHKKRLLRIQAEGGSDEDWTDLNDDIFSDEFLLTRPLLEAIRAEEPVVLLIDEVDRVEVETEALLLEILSDYRFRSGNSAIRRTRTAGLPRRTTCLSSPSAEASLPLPPRRLPRHGA